ncbi:MAG: LacI family transcriptional regulator [Lachnospiraceae bacterium]|nr:LacI family transcriptional regulator [Lachnospiraceae bacterium]
MSKKITIDNIAAAMGVSKTTVSRTISGKGRISAKTRDRILSYIAENNYNPHALAKGLANSKTYNIAIVIPEEYNLVELPFFQKSLMGILEITEDADYDILLVMVKPNDITQLIKVITNNKVDGVILARTYQKDMAAEYLLEQKIPFVSMGSSNNELIAQVDNDHQTACYELTSLLLSQDIKRLALIGGDESHVVTENRYRGYVRAHQTNIIPLDQDIIYLNALYPAYIQRICDDLLKSRIDGIICMDDSICTILLSYLKSKKILIPEDIKIASFYHSAILDHNIPSITSIKFDEAELGRAACCKLLDILNESAKTPMEKPVGQLRYEIIIRESTTKTSS